MDKVNADKLEKSGTTNTQARPEYSTHGYSIERLYMQMIAKMPDYTVLPLELTSAVMLLYYIDLFTSRAKLNQKSIKIAQSSRVTATFVANLSRHGKFVRGQ